jgi:hypothetical protein
VKKEVRMRILKYFILFLFVAAAASAQTEDLGQSVFFNNEGAIILAADASVAVRKLDGPYVMFMLYLASKNENQSVSVYRDDVTMIYKDQEYKMPSLEEWRKNYKGSQNDIDLYVRLGKEALAMSQMRFYKFYWRYDFFPILGQGPLPSDQLSIQGQIAAKTKIYFKNPGFQKGDQILIKVKDHKNPELNGAVAVLLK